MSTLLPAVRALRARRSLILAYHGVGPAHPLEDPHNLCVSQERFEAQVGLLRRAGFRFLTVAELAELASGGPPPPGHVALSFDDGMENNHSLLLPLLRRHGLPATVYVATGLIGAPNPWMAPAAGARMMTEEEIGELAAAGIELGAHTVTHPDLSQLDRDACLREMAESRRELERIAGAPVRTLAYPFCRYGEAAMAAAADAGFTAAVTCEGRGAWRRFELPRAMITGVDGIGRFALKLAGAYHPLRDSAPGRAVRALTRSARARARRRGWS